MYTARNRNSRNSRLSTDSSYDDNNNTDTSSIYASLSLRRPPQPSTHDQL